MSGHSDELIPYLRRIEERVNRLVDDLDQLKLRMTTVLEDLAKLNEQADRLLDVLKGEQ